MTACEVGQWAFGWKCRTKIGVCDQPDAVPTPIVCPNEHMSTELMCPEHIAAVERGDQVFCDDCNAKGTKVYVALVGQQAPVPLSVQRRRARSSR